MKILVALKSFLAYNLVLYICIRYKENQMNDSILLTRRRQVAKQMPTLQKILRGSVVE